MKKLILLFFILTGTTVSAQWSNTTNQFYDSLHTPVTRALQAQAAPIVLQSYPDSGYFVIWQDDRNSSTTKTDIYAQKYDKHGNRLWADGGIPAVNGPNAQFYAFSSNQDYRNRSFAATDSAGGFYICYADDSVTNYSWYRVAVQHVTSTGSMIFPGAGYIVAYTPSTESYTFSSPLLIADGNKGFYICFGRYYYGSGYVSVYNYRDENGTMKYYGGGWVNQNAIQRSRLNSCGIQTYIEYPGTSVSDYNIWPDGQGGCNVIMSMSGNTAGQGAMLAYNRIWRAKKDSRVKTFFRNTNGLACPTYTEYKKGNAYLLYGLTKNITETVCGGSGSPLYVVTNERLTSNGYQEIDRGGYDYNYPKGVTVTTDGNINVDVIAVTRRTLANNTVSDFTVQNYCYRAEKYDSVPYQRAEHGNPDLGFNATWPDSTDKLNFVRDTLLASGNYYFDFSLSAGGSNIYAAALTGNYGPRQVRMQCLDVIRRSADSFAIEYRAPKAGKIIGSEVSTGFSGTNISYDFPMVTVSPSGRAVFSINEYGRSTRISPVSGGTELTWGAMGRPVGTGIYNYGYYGNDQPVVALDPANGSGLIAWRDSRYLPPTNTGSDIYMRHIDNLNTFNYSPPVKPVRLLPNPYGATTANPAVLYGTSRRYTPFEISSISYEPSTTTVAAIDDDYYLGRVQLFIQQNSGTIRSYNNQPYLDRNITVVSDSLPPAATIDMQLYFTKQEFDALKAADNSIINPGDLIIINQPNSTTTTPSVYAPVAGEKVIAPIYWDSLPGGYYIGFQTARFGNFFIMKSATANVCPGGNTSISAGITGAAYQWQMNIGLGFFNISTDPHYTGTNTATLQLINIPSSWYGYKFRAVADGIPGAPITLRFLANWTGAAADNNWHNPANWGCGAVPDANTDVVINSGAIIVNANASCRTLTVKPGAAVTVKPGVNLDVMK